MRPATMTPDTTHHSEPRDKTIAGRYAVIDRIGEGGQGVTWLARDIREDRHVVLKEFTLTKSSSLDSLVFFEREARVLARQDHPRIPKYVDFFEDEGRFFLAQDFVEGKSLHALIEDGRRWTEEELQAMTRQILEILVYLQSQDPPVIHRDIKPANLILSPQGEVVLVDFGAIHCLEQELHGAVHLVGTTGYMAPEQFTGRSLLATDLYSLGATLIHVASHRHPADMPCDGLTLKFASLIQLSKSFTRFLEILTNPIAEDRFSDAKEALYWLDHLSSIENFEPGPGHELMTRAGPPGTAVSIRRTAGALRIQIPGGVSQKEVSIAITTFTLATAGTLAVVGLLLRTGLRAPPFGLFILLVICAIFLMKTGHTVVHHWKRATAHRLEIGPETTHLITRNPFGRQKTQTLNTAQLKLDAVTPTPSAARLGRLPGHIEIRDGAWLITTLGHTLTHSERLWILDETAQLRKEEARNRRWRQGQKGQK